MRARIEAEQADAGDGEGPDDLEDDELDDAPADDDVDEMDDFLAGIPMEAI